MINILSNDKAEPSLKLIKPNHYDVAVIGGGLAGISTAYFLAKAGKRVLVLEAKTIGSGATAKTTAMLSPMIDTASSDLIDMLGFDQARTNWNAGEIAIKTVEEIVRREKISCSFMRVPLYLYASSESYRKDVEEEQKAVVRLGGNAKLIPVRDANASLRRTQAAGTSPQFPFEPHALMQLPKQAKFDATAYIEGLQNAAKKYGATIREHMPVTKLRRLRNAGFAVMTARESFTADSVVVATYAPFNNPTPTHYKKGMYVSYCFSIEIPVGLFPEGIYWDSDNPYHYFRIDRGDNHHDTMIVGGEDHRIELKMSPHKNFRALEEYVKILLSGHDYTITSRWTGPILEPSDGLPLIGAYEEDAYVATAFSGNGMTYSTIAGILISDLILHRPNAWKKLYDPTRPFKIKRLLKKGRDYTGELFGGAVKNALK